MKQALERIEFRIHDRVSHLQNSPTLAINEKAKSLIAEGQTIFHFGFGQSPFPVPEIVVEALKHNAHQKDYLPSSGYAPLRKAVAQFYSHQIGRDYLAENVLIGPGSKFLIYQVMMALDGTLLLPIPSWVSYAPQAKMLGKQIVKIPTRQSENWKITPAALSQALDQAGSGTKLLILNYPNNPIGNTYTKEELEGLSSILRKGNVIVISDEIYGQVHHGRDHHSLMYFYPEGCIISGGMSKWCGAGGWRMGTMVFPAALNELVAVMTKIASETFSAVSAPVQYAAVKAYQADPSIEKYLNHSRKILQFLAKWVYQSLDAVNVRLAPPDGGFYLFPDFSAFEAKLKLKGITTSQNLCEVLLEEANVVLLPGTAFGMPPASLTARLAFVNFDGEAALEASYAWGDQSFEPSFLHLYCPKVEQGVLSLINWLTD